MKYHAIKNIVYDQDGEVMMVVVPVGFRKWVAKFHAEMIAESMNEHDEGNGGEPEVDYRGMH